MLCSLSCRIVHTVLLLSLASVLILMPTPTHYSEPLRLPSPPTSTPFDITLSSSCRVSNTLFSRSSHVHTFSLHWDFQYSHTFAQTHIAQKHRSSLVIVYYSSFDSSLASLSSCSRVFLHSCCCELCPLDMASDSFARKHVTELLVVAICVTQCVHSQRRQPSIQIGGAGGGVVTPSTTGRRQPPSSPDQPLINERAHRITFGAILPTTALITVRRAYYKRISDSVENLMRDRQAKFNFTNHYRISQAQVVMISLNPSPTEVLSTLCQQLLVKDVSTVIYMTNSDVYGHNVASAQYLMQLTGYLGIPMIAWNADNIGLEQVS